VPQAPLRPFQAAHRSFSQEGRVGRGPAEAAGGLQRVLEAHRGVPPVEHDCGARQHLALQPPQPGIAVAQHGRGRVRVDARPGERLAERLGRAGTVKLSDRERDKAHNAGRAHRRSRHAGNAGHFGPGLEGAGLGGSVLGGGDVITAEMEEVADLVVRGEETLGVPG
jgi:hypothetical protein